MTTDQLERDLKTLGGPRPGDERLHAAIRTTLDDRLHTRPTRRRPALRLGGAAVAAATVAAAIFALVGTNGSGGPSGASAAILARLARTLSPPPNLIVHVKETGVLADGTQVGAEWWQETDAPYRIRLIKGRVGQQTEVAADGTIRSQYDPGTNTVYEQPDSTPPTLVDPIETVRAALADGRAQVAGTVTIDGRPLYEVDLSDGVVGYFDTGNYRPVYLDNPQRDGSLVRTRVVAYDELPLGVENGKLLSVAAQHPDARVVTGPAPGPASGHR